MKHMVVCLQMPVSEDQAVRKGTFMRDKPAFMHDECMFRLSLCENSF